MPDHLLLVFLKAPRPGQVKTRLAAEVGGEAAARLYRALAERVLAQTAPLADDAYRRVVFFAPADARDEVAAWLPGETLVAQEDSDLGQRMDAAFAAAFARGASRAVLVGSDVPRLSRAHVLEALAALESRPLVLGPATDGGYYLVGLRERRPELFRDIPWGTASVRTATLERAASLGLDVHLLEPLRDVDTAADLEAEGPFGRG
jgi:rSAM/selenodomain-associated transferase 1